MIGHSLLCSGSLAGSSVVGGLGGGAGDVVKVPLGSVYVQQPWVVEQLLQEGIKILEWEVSTFLTGVFRNYYFIVVS